MRQVEQRYEFGVPAAVAAGFAAFWLVMVATSPFPEYQSQYVLTAIAVTLIGAPWVLAVRLLWRA